MKTHYWLRRSAALLGLAATLPFNSGRAQDQPKTPAITPAAQLAPKGPLVEPYVLQIVQGALARNLPQRKVEKIFDLMEQFAGYGFNKSHSAAYAYLAYVTAYLKAHYPVDFMAALLTSETGNTAKVVKYINECRAMGITILPPDVNASE